MVNHLSEKVSFQNLSFARDGPTRARALPLLELLAAEVDLKRYEVYSIGSYAHGQELIASDLFGAEGVVRYLVERAATLL